MLLYNLYNVPSACKCVGRFPPRAAPGRRRVRFHYFRAEVRNDPTDGPYDQVQWDRAGKGRGPTSPLFAAFSLRNVPPAPRRVPAAVSRVLARKHAHEGRLIGAAAHNLLRKAAWEMLSYAMRPTTASGAFRTGLWRLAVKGTWCPCRGAAGTQVGGVRTVLGSRRGVGRTGWSLRFNVLRSRWQARPGDSVGSYNVLCVTQPERAHRTKSTNAIERPKCASRS